MNDGFITSIKYVKEKLPQLSRNASQIIYNNNKSFFEDSYLPLNNLYNVSSYNVSSHNQSSIKQLDNIRKSRQKVKNQSKKIKQAIEDKMLEDYFKDKCFEDFDIRVHNKDFIFNSNIVKTDDRKIQSQLLFMKKRTGFWNAFCKYVNPKLAGQRFDQMRSQITKHKTPIEIAIELQLNNSKSQKNLYTNSKSFKRVFHHKVSDQKIQSNFSSGKLRFVTPIKLF